MGKILVVGVGNSIMGDDGLGVWALSELKSREVPDYVETVEAGTALACAMPDLRDYDKVVFIDAVDADGQPVSVLRNPAFSQLPERSLSLHELGIEEALRLCLLVDGKLPEIVIVGLKPERIELGMELSQEVASKIPQLVEAVLDEIR
jgi:hydrogenase maturation protease